MATKNPRKMLPAPRSTRPPSRAPAPVVVRRPPPRRRNAAIGSNMSKNLGNVGAAAVGGAGLGAVALELAKRLRTSPSQPPPTMAVAVGTGVLGAVATALLPKGSPWSSLASAATGLGAGLAVIDFMQKPPAAMAPAVPVAPAAVPVRPAYPVAMRQADGDYVTADDLNQALRRAMLQQHEDTVRAVRAELRNAGGFAQQPMQYAPTSAWQPSFVDNSEPEPGSWQNAPALPGDYDARNAGEWQNAAEPYDQRNAGSWQHASETDAA